MATIKSKIKLHALTLVRATHRSRRLAKKISQDLESTRYPEMWINKWINKKVNKLFKIAKVEVNVKGLGNIPKGTAILAPNHASSMDPAIMLYALANHDKKSNKLNKMVVFLSKDDIKDNKKVNGFANMLKTVYIDRNKPREALKALDTIASHAKETRKHIVIFPEGTRTKTGEMQEFKSGAFKIAQRAFLPIVPVTINNSLSITDFANRTDKIVIDVIIHKPLKPIQFVAQKTSDIATNVQKIVNSAWVQPEGARPTTEDKV